MGKDVKIGIIILAFASFALGIVFYININDSFSFLSGPVYGEGLGNLCSSEEECRNFCFVLGQRGRCDEYCELNPSNTLCEKLYAGIK